MYSIITGSILISLLHSVIPNHWLPIIAIGRREKWTHNDVVKITLVCGIAHGVSTGLLGLFLGIVGHQLDKSVSFFTRIAAPAILILVGIIFIYRHHIHMHFHLDENVKKKRSKRAIVMALTAAMFLSPCLEIEAFFLMAGAIDRSLTFAVAILYVTISTMGMVMLVSQAYRGLLKLNWHLLEHNAGIVTGITLVVTGIVTFFIG